MALVDIEVGLSAEEVAVRDTVHRFAEEVMRPAGAALDRLSDPGEVIEADSVLWEVHSRYQELGLEPLEPDPDLAKTARLRFLIAEELGWGDAGLAISFGAGGFPRLLSRLSGQPELIERFGADGNNEIGCWAITEPDHGSNMLHAGGFGGSSGKPNCVARRDGDDYLITGTKAAWVSNGTIATSAALFCAVSDGNGIAGGGVFLVALDSAGVSRGKPLDKLGQRALNQGELFFDDVRVPAGYMVAGPEAYGFMLENVLCLANAGMGATFVGLSRAALEHALAYSKERVQGGVAIFEHQSVKARLFKMFSQVEASRSLARRAMLYNMTNPPLLQYSVASKVFSTNTAFEVASAALQIFGGNGLSVEYPIEKLLRDARAAMIEDGCNDLLSLVGAEKL
ncbi:MAG: acyl-CoA dehydrogenase family protein [Candidatus Binatia bacterium]